VYQEYTSFLELFKIDPAVIGAILIGIIAVTNFLKAQFPQLTGKWIMLPVGALSLLASIYAFPGNTATIVVATLVLTVIACGGWDSMKVLAHKAAEPKVVAKK